MTAARASLVQRLEAEALQIRRNVWRALHAAGSGHVGDSVVIACGCAVKHPTRMRLVGMPDVFAVVGPTVPLRAKYGMSAEAIITACRSLLDGRVKDEG
jgi:transketolase C-terminal domain/subunit